MQANHPSLRDSYLCMSFALILIIALSLSSCSTKKQDGPPHFYVDETKIPNAVPKPEPLAKYGNMKTYYVFGKPYHVLPSRKHYQAIGTASWYGTKFHNHLTSSGERYNMLSMTAAHRTLPLPTYVEVTNLRNHRKVIVKVNDRGPFMSHRLIDLSYVAAKKLGMLGHGTTPVKIRAIDFDSRKKPTLLTQRSLFSPIKRADYFDTGLSSSKMIYFQVGAFKNRANAEKLRHHLSALLETPVQIAAPLRGKLYRVQVGPINDPHIANKITERLKMLGIKANRFYGV